MTNNIKYAIALYLVILFILFSYKPKLLKKKQENNIISYHCILPFLIIIISIISYYIVASFEWFRT